MRGMSAALQTPPKYSRRRPELTPCYKILQGHLDTFIAEREAEGRPLPDYIKEEFEAYMRCGIPAFGFLRLKCKSCEEEIFVAFSCKKRGFCPSCCAKRMVEAATHLTDNVLPMVPYRQFVISFPIPLRYWMHSNKKLFAKIHSLVIKQLHTYYKQKAQTMGLAESTPGSISFTQRWGSALNLNPHFHVICADGVYINHLGKARFKNIDPITDNEVAELITKISERVLKYLQRQGYLNNEGEIITNPAVDEMFSEYESLKAATQASIAGKIAFGPNAGKYVTKIGSGFGYGEEIALAKGKRCYSINGFSLHANTSINTHQRERLFNLIQYVARGPLSNKRLEITQDGKVKLELKTAWSDGTTHLLFTFCEFIEKLAALIPPKKSHLVRWGGVFAPNAPLRQEIILKPKVKKGFQFKEEEEKDKPVRNYSWSKMLAKVFKIDVTKCQGCGGDLAKVSAIMSQEAIKRYLSHIGVDHLPPSRAPPNSTQESFDFDQSHSYIEPIITLV